MFIAIEILITPTKLHYFFFFFLGFIPIKNLIAQAASSTSNPNLTEKEKHSAKDSIFIQSSSAGAAFEEPPAFLGRSRLWMLGMTPPPAIVTSPKSLDSSSSFLTASWMCLGTILVFLLSLAAFPASSRTCSDSRVRFRQNTGGEATIGFEKPNSVRDHPTTLIESHASFKLVQ